MGNLQLDGTPLPGEDASFTYPESLASPLQVTSRPCLPRRASLSFSALASPRLKPSLQGVRTDTGLNDVQPEGLMPCRSSSMPQMEHRTYGNKFGEPLIAGYTRTFGLRMPSGERREWIKPIMFRHAPTSKPHHMKLGPVDQLHMHVSAAAVTSGLSEAFSIDSVGTTFKCRQY